MPPERSGGPIEPGPSDLSVYQGLEELRAAGKQPSVKVPPCLGCGGLPHGSDGEYVRCLENRVKALEAGK